MRKKILFILCLMSLALPNYSQIPEQLSFGLIIIDSIDIGAVKIGENTLKFSVSNHSDSVRNIYVSIRAEGLNNWQRTQFYKIWPGQSMNFKKEYIISDAASKLLRVKIGLPTETYTSEIDPRYEMFENQIEWTELKSFKLNLDFPYKKPEFWCRTDRANIRANYHELRKELNQLNQDERHNLLEKVRYKRSGFENFASKKVKTTLLDGGTFVESWELEGEPGEPIGFLFMQNPDLHKPYKTVLYLTGNPPGRKEPQINKLLLLAEAGYRVVVMDRRVSARKTEVGEFWNNAANPVFDAMHLIDYLMTLDETDKINGIAIIGFSKGAAESHVVAALHEDVTCAVLCCRMIDNDVLFESAAWWPTLYIPELIVEMGADSILAKPWQDQLDFMTPEVLNIVKQKFNELYAFYDSKRILKLIAPKPLLLITGAWDVQFPIQGVLSLDMEIASYYQQNDVLPAYNLYVMPRMGHQLDISALGIIIDYLDVWFD